MHWIALNSVALHCIAVHCIESYSIVCIELHWIHLHCIALHCIALNRIALHALNFIEFSCIALQCIVLHWIALHCMHWIMLNYKLQELLVGATSTSYCRLPVTLPSAHLPHSPTCCPPAIDQTNEHQKMNKPTNQQAQRIAIPTGGGDDTVSYDINWL